MPLQQLGTIDVYRPRLEAEEFFVIKARQYFQSLGYPVTTDDHQQILDILCAYYDYCESEFSATIQKIASRELVEFLFHQLHLWDQVHEQRVNGQLTEEEQLYDSRYGSIARLAIQYVVESTTKLQPFNETAAVPESVAIFLTDYLMVVSEEMARTSAYITMERSVFPGKGNLSMSLESGKFGFEYGPRNDLGMKFQKFMSGGLFNEAGPYSHLISPSGDDEPFQFLDSTFESEHGITLLQTLRIMLVTDRSCKPPPDGFDVKFVLEDGFFETVSHNAQLSVDRVQWALSGVTLTKEPLNLEDRQLWRPKQSNRLLRRPFVRLPHQLGHHLCWHSSRIRYSFMYLLQEFCFGRVPNEWQTPKITRRVWEFARSLDKQWETVVADELRTRNIHGDQGLKKLLSKDGTVSKIPNEVGEIDYLGWNPTDDSLVLIEAKRLQPAYSPTQFRDDVSKFTSENDGYFTQHARKVTWLRENWKRVCEHLVRKKILREAPTNRPTIRSAIITKFENIVQLLGDQPQVTSLRKLVEHFDDTEEWLWSRL